MTHPPDFYTGSNVPVGDGLPGVDVWKINRGSAMDLLLYWNLDERPFEATWDTRFFFRSAEHEEALERLEFVALERSMNIGMITGEIGCGKTLLGSVFTENLPDNQYEVVVQENSCFRFNDLLGSVLRALGAEQQGDDVSKIARYERFKAVAQEIHAAGRHLVLLFDEAQEMPSNTLTELKLLTNLNGGGGNYLTVLLLGQPELRKRISKFPALDQRIMVRYHLSALSEEYSAAYLEHRLRAAGHPTGDLFERDAARAAHLASRGIPRELNRIAKLALEVAWMNEFKSVNRDAVEAVVRDLQRHQTLAAA